ncbi:MAG: four helix bundle protein [Acidobacteria bacterium]|nr:MAG: four helix bundle protein [Acidobacteriota bacterium]
MGAGMSEEAEALKARTMSFALDVCRLIRELPREEPGPTAKRQLAKAATSVAMNYRASCRARSHTEFTAKMGLVAEEADESQGWLEFIDAASLIVSAAELARLLQESTELCAIVSTSFATARRKEHERKRKRKP